MDEGLLDGDGNRHPGYMAPELEAGKYRLVVDDRRIAVHPQGLPQAGYEEDQADFGVVHDVAHRVQPVVAGTIRD